MEKLEPNACLATVNLWLLELGFSPLEIALLLGLGRTAYQRHLSNPQLPYNKCLSEKLVLLTDIYALLLLQHEDDAARMKYLSQPLKKYGATPLSIISTGQSFHIRQLLHEMKKTPIPEMLH